MSSFSMTTQGLTPALLTRDKLEEMGWETLEHLPYSPDLSPCDYFLECLVVKKVDIFSESVLDDSSVLEHKNKDIEESHNQVIDASGDETEDDEFFVLPSQTVKEFKSNRKDKSNKMADLSLTEDIFDPSVVAKHYKNKDSSTSKLEINSSKDIFELETQGDDFDGVCKSSVGVPEDRNLMDIDTECVFNTEAQLTVRDQNNQDDTSIFEAETQEMGLSQLQIQKAEKSCDIDIFDAESELAECQRELHNKNKEFESSGKENVKNEDKLNDMNKSGTDNVNSSNALEEDEISDLALSAVLSQVNSSLESLKASNNGLKDITKELTQPNADNKDQENGSGSIVAHKEQKSETQPNLLLEKSILEENGRTNMEDEVGFEAETQLNVRLEKPNLDKNGRINVEDDTGFEAETQLNVGLEKPSLDRNGKTNVEDEVGFEAETQLNVRLEKPSLDKNGRLNVEDEVGFEAETQLNVRLEKPSLDRNGKTNVEDDVGFEAETQLNKKPSLDRNGKTNVEDEVGFEAETQLNVRLEKPSLDKNGRLNVEDEVGFEAETQLNVRLEKPSLDRNGKTNVEDEVGFEAETQLNVRLEKPSLDKNGRLNVEDEVGFEAETQPNLKILNPRVRALGDQFKRGEQVLFTGFSNATYEANIKKLGGTVVDSPDNCTVLVTDKVRRTVKFLCVLGQGKPIVDPEWIEKSWRCTCFEDPMNHLLLDVEAQSRFNFDLRLTINEAKKQPMLTGYTVYATPSVKPPPDDIKSIVESCGGEFLPKVPSKWPDQTIVISHPDDKPLWKKLKVKGSTPPIVAAEFLLLGVLQHRIDIQTHKIS
ncbi:uncharacterized protein LOC124368265 [Homalodisca vitripennis]|uniref:uncharacterized protein LOC124368265 n=1 Tax=Homalodisca vitripennis TaxID=197043 RepID=UPI001EEB3782|nr:uncharacterized protein LOC124368265 [Homalodisca vitripennis]